MTADQQVLKEKLPDWFEKDFFLHDPQQRTWDELEVGESYDTAPFVVTRERIEKYAAGTEDNNPFYLDEAAALNSQFKGMIAPPTIIVPIVFAAIRPDSWVKMPGAVNPGQKLEFGVPVRVGDLIQCKIVLIDKMIKRGKKYTVARMHITNQNDEMVCIWTGGLVLPK
ncbi:MAG: MaoC family dehydratase [Desulfobacteraceae bacterium]|nr:MaoC family dehydratase [Desulfobacteraceae bacterium]MBU4055249.1 MaoC family dehydratase N-terminal domain-containing protein [Pseudomonadota bacterium]